MLLILLVSVQLFILSVMFTSAYKLFLCFYIDGNGFKTSTMRLGADVIVFSRSGGKPGKRLLLLPPFNDLLLCSSISQFSWYKFGNWPRAYMLLEFHAWTCHNSCICSLSAYQHFMFLISYVQAFLLIIICRFIYSLDDHHSMIFLVTCRTEYL